MSFDESPDLNESNIMYIVKEDNENIGAFFNHSSANIFMNTRATRFLDECISSSYRFFKEESEDGDEIFITGYHRFLGIIPYESNLKTFSCEKITLNPQD